jgi:hypothetical protein
MPKYVGYLTQSRYRSFEFEADDEVLAWDHFEKLVDDYRRDPETLMTMATESGPDELILDDVVEL